MDVTLTVVPDELEAEALCGLLRTEGIRCSYRHTNMSAALSPTLDIVGSAEVVVDEADLERARELLAAR